MGGIGAKEDTKAFVNANFHKFSQSAAQATVVKRLSCAAWHGSRDFYRGCRVVRTSGRLERWKQRGAAKEGSPQAKVSKQNTAAPPVMHLRTCDSAMLDKIGES